MADRCNCTECRNDWREYERRPVTREARQVDRETLVDTSHGEVLAEPGDYIVRGQDGETWPVAKERFEDLYREVDADE